MSDRGKMSAFWQLVGGDLRGYDYGISSWMKHDGHAVYM